MSEKKTSSRLQSLFLVSLLAVGTYLTFSFASSLGTEEESQWTEVLLTKRSSSFLKTPGFRILVAVGVFVILNVVVITVHHVVQKVSRSTTSYKSIEHVVSPF